MDFPCVCNDPKRMHELSIGGVCTRRYCKCLSYRPLHSVPGALRNQEAQHLAVDLVIERNGRSVVSQQRLS